MKIVKSTTVAAATLVAVLFSGCVKQPSACGAGSDCEVDSKTGLLKPIVFPKASTQESGYEKERKAFLEETMYSSKIPLKTPDKIIRTLILPYVNENQNLQTENFHFSKVDEGRWILGEYIYGQDRGVPTHLTPLK
ncbi:MAG: TraV family lipoprotein [Sulfurimonadaceae bacterium]|jgi:hypothetical protein|nr:TraV family lipoprotein [Sulfurimonadaceae bacterium]